MPLATPTTFTLSPGLSIISFASAMRSRWITSFQKPMLSGVICTVTYRKHQTSSMRLGK
jgi:hypothetical protein